VSDHVVFDLIPQKSTDDCAIAALAMLLGLPYQTVAAAAPKRRKGGLSTRQIMRLSNNGAHRSVARERSARPRRVVRAGRRVVLRECAVVGGSRRVRRVGEVDVVRAYWEGRVMEMKTFSSGAKSTVEKPRYDLIPLRALKLIADRFEYGASRHGERNYQKGAHDATFVRDRINHLIEHAAKYAVLRDEENLSAILCNAAILADLHEIRENIVADAPAEKI
jgi:hypothetical protein